MTAIQTNSGNEGLLEFLKGIGYEFSLEMVNILRLKDKKSIIISKKQVLEIEKIRRAVKKLNRKIGNDVTFYRPGAH